MNICSSRSRLSVDSHEFHSSCLLYSRHVQACVATPSVFKQESFPWAVETPEASPMCWGIRPDVTYDGYSQGIPASQPVISREVLRAVCEPFFEQMLTALQQTLQVTQRQQFDTDMRADPTSQMTKPAAFQA